MIEVEKFSKNHGDFAFGLDRKRAAASLRELADAIESGELLPQSVLVVSKGQNADFAFHTLILKCAKKLKPAVVKYLYGEGPFAVSVGGTPASDG